VCRELADNGIVGGVGVGDYAGSRCGARTPAVWELSCVWSAAVRLLLKVDGVYVSCFLPEWERGGE
jgi:hypothetical protein